MSELIRHTGNWWAPSSKHARRTTVGTIAIVVVLALITWAIWLSPGNPVSSAVTHALGVETPEQKAADAKATAAQLQVQLTAAQERIWKLEGQLRSANASGASRAQRLADLQSQLKGAYAELGTAKAAAAGHTTASGAKGSSGGTSGSGSSGGSHVGGSGSSSANGGTGSSGSAPVAAGNPASVSKPATPQVTAPTKAEVLAQTSRWYGLYTPQSPFNWADYDAIQQKVGTAANMAGYFQGFDQPFNASAVQRSWANDRLPVMTWETSPATTGNDSPYVAGYTNEDVISGKFDAYIKQYADAVKANGMPLVIRLDHEMNGSWYNWSEGISTLPADEQNPTGSYVAMWQHVWNVFQQEGANDDVIWDWSPTRIDNLSPNKNSVKLTQGYLDEYYPGDQYVDWVGMSGYYRDTTTAPTFTETFSKTLTQIRALPHTEGPKPIFLAEIGATESGGSIGSPDAPSQKAAWMTSLFDALADPQNKDIIGFAYFDETATTIVEGVRSTNDWRIDSRADSLAAFTAGIERTDTDYDLQEVSK